ncbi:MAG: Na+/H+ antiporter NhaA, partial [Pseudomonadota bacterium]
MYRVWNFVTNYSLLLIIGAILALIWANTAAHSYHLLVEYPLWFNDLIGYDIHHWEETMELHHLHPEDFAHGDVHRVLTVHYLVNDILMAFFFAIAGKEVWEAVILKNGSLRGKKAATPLFATVGGMVGPIAVYLGLALMMGSAKFGEVANGWAIPTATDIAFSYLVGRLVFGAGHPAVRFLLLLAIADDAAGLVILAVFYPEGELAPAWLLLSVAAFLPRKDPFLRITASHTSF